MNNEQKDEKTLADFIESHDLVIEECIGEYIFEKGIKFDCNKKLIILSSFYDVYRHKVTKEWAIMPVFYEG